VARDLRLGLEAQAGEPETLPPVLVSETEAEIRRKDVPRHEVRRMARVGAETFVIIFLLVVVLVAAALVINPQNFLTLTRRGFAVAKQNLNEWVMLVTHQEGAPKGTNPEVEVKWEDHRIKIEYGSSIYKIATDTYGAHAALGIDLIKEYNPQIRNLNRVSAGQDLVVPPLTRETLLQKKSDGSYRLIVASFANQTAADEQARLLDRKRYRATITPRKVSDDLLLYRVEIDGLKNFEQANQIWEAGLRNEWLAFAGKPSRVR
jgi:hypothetical protein